MKDFISFKEALELKQLGFDEPCFATYIGETFDSSVQFQSDDYFTAAPTFSQAFRFFREKYDLQYWLRNGGYLGKCFVQITGYKHDKIYFSSSEPMEYEEAELACLKKLIELAKNNTWQQQF